MPSSAPISIPKYISIISDFQEDNNIQLQISEANTEEAELHMVNIFILYIKLQKTFQVIIGRKIINYCYSVSMITCIPNFMIRYTL